MTSEQQIADQRCVQEFEAAADCFSRGASPETYRVQVNRVLENAAKLPPARCKHWLSELERIGEVIPKPEPVKNAGEQVTRTLTAGGQSKP